MNCVVLGYCWLTSCLVPMGVAKGVQFGDRGLEAFVWKCLVVWVAGSSSQPGSNAVIEGCDQPKEGQYVTRLFGEHNTDITECSTPTRESACCTCACGGQAPKWERIPRWWSAASPGGPVRGGREWGARHGARGMKKFKHRERHRGCGLFEAASRSTWPGFAPTSTQALPFAPLPDQIRRYLPVSLGRPPSWGLTPC